MKYKYPLVEVVWDDAEADTGWEEIPKELKPEPVITVGFLVKKTDSHILIASSYSEHHVNSRMQIPAGMIIKMKPVKVPK